MKKFSDSVNQNQPDSFSEESNVEYRIRAQSEGKCDRKTNLNLGGSSMGTKYREQETWKWKNVMKRYGLGKSRIM
jgi:hypothetical protein